MTWLSRHADTIQAGAAVVTATTAVLAVTGVLAQMRAADDTSRAQTAREAYAAHLMTSVSNPEYAAPDDTCGMMASPKRAAYAAYVDHLMYAAELMMEAEPGWQPTFAEAIAPHAAYVCAEIEAGAYSGDMTVMLGTFRADVCPAMPPCGAVPPT
jgi:hypothetical protein